MGMEYRKNLIKKVGDNFRMLTHREQRILSMRYGVGEEQKTVKQVAAVFGVTESTIYKHEGLAIRKLEKIALAK